VSSYHYEISTWERLAETADKVNKIKTLAWNKLKKNKKNTYRDAQILRCCII